MNLFKVCLLNFQDTFTCDTYKPVGTRKKKTRVKN